MKAGFATSTILHAVILGSALVSLSTAKPLDSDFDEIPIIYENTAEETLTVKGDEQAKLETPPAPKETKSPPKLPDTQAENVGDTDRDAKSVDAPQTIAPPVEKTQAPTPSSRPKAETKPDPVPVPKPQVKPEPEQETKTDLALLIEKSKPDEVEKVDENSFEPLPQKVPAPKKRPSPPKPEQAAKKPDDKKPEDKKDRKAEDKKKKKAVEKATVNNQESGSGKKRNTKKAGGGAKTANNTSKLSASELAALRGRLEGCWGVTDLTGHPDAATMRVRVSLKLTPTGEIDGRVKVKVSGTSGRMKATLATRTRSSIIECAPYDLKGDSELVVNFSLQDML